MLVCIAVVVFVPMVLAWNLLVRCLVDVRVGGACVLWEGVLVEVLEPTSALVEHAKIGEAVWEPHVVDVWLETLVTWPCSWRHHRDADWDTHRGHERELCTDRGCELGLVDLETREKGGCLLCVKIGMIWCRVKWLCRVLVRCANIEHLRAS